MSLLVLGDWPAREHALTAFAPTAPSVFLPCLQGIQDIGNAAANAMHGLSLSNGENTYRSKVDQAMLRAHNEVGFFVYSYTPIPVHMSMAPENLQPVNLNLIMSTLMSVIKARLMRSIQPLLCHASLSAQESEGLCRLKSGVLQLESMGEMILAVGASGGWGPTPLTKDELDQLLDELIKEMDQASADVTFLRPRSDGNKGDISLLYQLVFQLSASPTDWSDWPKLLQFDVFPNQLSDFWATKGTSISAACGVCLCFSANVRCAMLFFISVLNSQSKTYLSVSGTQEFFAWGWTCIPSLDRAVPGTIVDCNFRRQGHTLAQSWARHMLRAVYQCRLDSWCFGEATEHGDSPGGEGGCDWECWQWQVHPDWCAHSCHTRWRTRICSIQSFQAQPWREHRQNLLHWPTQPLCMPLSHAYLRSHLSSNSLQLQCLKPSC